MSIKGIIIDSMTYPFSNWMRFLFLSIIILISFSPYTFSYLVKINYPTFICLNIVGLLVIGSFVMGYLFKVISESLKGVNKLPTFNNWSKMFVNGIKILIVNIVYLIPALIIILIFYPNLSILSLDKLIAWFPYFIPLLIAPIYLIIIIPVISMSIAHMADNNGKLGAAFKFGKILTNVSKLAWDRFTWQRFVGINDLIPLVIGFLIFDEITDRILSVDLRKIIIWYIVTGVISLILILIGYFITDISPILILNSLDLYSLSNYNILRILIFSLVLLPYLFIFLSRSTALIYDSAIKSYLISKNYTENYQLNQE